MIRISNGLTEIRFIIPDPEVLLSLEVEELAGVLLLHLNSGEATLPHYNFLPRLENLWVPPVPWKYKKHIELNG